MMHDPPVPGAVLAQHLGGLSMQDAAAKIGIGQEHLANLIIGVARIDDSLATKLGRALVTSPDLWKGLQTAYDNRQSAESDLLGFLRDQPVHELKGMFSAPSGVTVFIEDMHRGPSRDDLVDWDNLPPIGREFGSPDYDRLEELDNMAVKAMGDMLKARCWLEAPDEALDRLTPEEAARTAEGLARVKALLMQKT